jgi:ADP-heptose:LPS heptosyltransferase
VAVAKAPLLLVLRALGLGDFLTGLPALRALRDSYPDHWLVLAAPAPLEPLARLSGAVDELCPTGPLAPLAEALTRADLAVDLHGKGPETHRILLRSQPKRLFAFAHAEIPETAGMPAWRADEHEVHRWCRLLTESGVRADPGWLELAPPKRTAAPDAETTVIHPGAASAARRWPAERFAAVARSERKSGRRVLVTGSPGELGLASEVARLAGLEDADVLAGKTDLLGLAALVAGAGRVVCGDTGVGHLATAFGTPSVVLFGPTSPKRWGPPPERRRHRVLWAGIAGDPHASVIHPGLLRIEVADVLNEIAELDRLPRAVTARPASERRRGRPLTEQGQVMLLPLLGREGAAEERLEDVARAGIVRAR